MKPIVYVVDDDAAVRGAILDLLRADDLVVRDFACGSDFVARVGDDEASGAPSCLVCDMHMPELDGLQVAAEMARLDAAMPIIFLTGFGTIPLSVRAMKAGAVEFLTKPVVPDELLRAVHAALVQDAAAGATRRELAELRRRHASLTPRERETMQLAIGGLLNKQIAGELGVSEIMAKTHKRKVMEKMAARSLPDLVRHAERLRIEKTRSR